MLNEIKAALEEFNLPVDYGKVVEDYPDWNFYVFVRTITKRTGTSKVDYNHYYQVHIVRENFIPEGHVLEVINKMVQKTSMRLAEEQIQYDYVTKNNTTTVVEMATITFTKAEKGVSV